MLHHAQASIGHVLGLPETACKRSGRMQASEIPSQPRKAPSRCEERVAVLKVRVGRRVKPGPEVREPLGEFACLLQLFVGGSGRRNTRLDGTGNRPQESRGHDTTPLRHRVSLPAGRPLATVGAFDRPDPRSPAAAACDLGKGQRKPVDAQEVPPRLNALDALRMTHPADSHCAMCPNPPRSLSDLRRRKMLESDSVDLAGLRVSADPTVACVHQD